MDTTRMALDAHKERHVVAMLLPRGAKEPFASLSLCETARITGDAANWRVCWLNELRVDERYDAGFPSPPGIDSTDPWRVQRYSVHAPGSFGQVLYDVEYSYTSGTTVDTGNGYPSLFFRTSMACALHSSAMPPGSQRCKRLYSSFTPPAPSPVQGV